MTLYHFSFIVTFPGIACTQMLWDIWSKKKKQNKTGCDGSGWPGASGPGETDNSYLEGIMKINQFRGSMALSHHFFKKKIFFIF